MGDPLEVLRNSHRRIERCLDVLARAATKKEERDAFRAALQDLRDAAPKHTADEEDSLFPRLRRQKDSRLLPVVARIESLEEEHLCADRVHAEVDALGRCWLTTRTLRSEDALRLLTLTAQLRDIYRHHMAVEDNEVFPVAAVALSSAVLRDIASEMASRWGVAP